VLKIRKGVIMQLAEDMKELHVNFIELYKVMSHHLEFGDTSYHSFEKYLQNAGYEEQMVREIAKLLGEAEQMIEYHQKHYHKAILAYEKTKKKLTNQTIELRDKIRKLHMQYDRIYFQSIYQIDNETIKQVQEQLNEVDGNLTETGIELH
jgi:murein L,D-transpeptidase YafK